MSHTRQRQHTSETVIIQKRHFACAQLPEQYFPTSYQANGSPVGNQQLYTLSFVRATLACPKQKFNPLSSNSRPWHTYIQQQLPTHTAASYANLISIPPGIFSLLFLSRVYRPNLSCPLLFFFFLFSHPRAHARNCSSSDVYNMRDRVLRCFLFYTRYIYIAPCVRCACIFIHFGSFLTLARERATYILFSKLKIYARSCVCIRFFFVSTEDLRI